MISCEQGSQFSDPTQCQLISHRRERYLIIGRERIYRDKQHALWEDEIYRTAHEMIQYLIY
jgi:hypothetical protein